MLEGKFKALPEILSNTENVFLQATPYPSVYPIFAFPQKSWSVLWITCSLPPEDQTSVLEV